MNAIFLKAQVKCTEAGVFLKDGPRRVLRRLAKDERAVSVIEYAILLGVIVGGTVLAVNQFGDQIEAAITAIGTRVTTTVSNVGNT